MTNVKRYLNLIEWVFGYLIQKGRLESSAVAKRASNSFPSFGAVIIILGKLINIEISYTPWWVGPSGPTKPALSKKKITGSFF